MNKQPLNKYTLGDKVIKPNGQVGEIDAITICRRYDKDSKPVVEVTYTVDGRGDGGAYINERAIVLAEPEKPRIRTSWEEQFLREQARLHEDMRRTFKCEKPKITGLHKTAALREMMAHCDRQRAKHEAMAKTDPHWSIREDFIAAAKAFRKTLGPYETLHISVHSNPPKPPSSAFDIFS